MQAIKLRKALKIEHQKNLQRRGAKLIGAIILKNLATQYLAERRLSVAATDVQREYRGFCGRKIAETLRKERVLQACCQIQGHLKTLYCRTLLTQFQASKAFHKAGKCVLATREMNRLMDYTGRHHLL